MKKHLSKALVPAIVVIHECPSGGNLSSCLGFSPVEEGTDPGKMFICKHRQIGPVGKPVYLCNNPPAVVCPVSPYRKQDSTINSTRERDMRVAADTFLWLVDEYCSQSKERDDLILALNGIVSQFTELAIKPFTKEDNKYSSPFK